MECLSLVESFPWASSAGNEGEAFRQISAESLLKPRKEYHTSHYLEQDRSKLLKWEQLGSRRESLLPIELGLPALWQYSTRLTSDNMC